MIHCAAPESSSPKFLYHYTDSNGFVGIFEKDLFRVSDPRFSNDKSEGLVAFQLFCEMLANLPSRFDKYRQAFNEIRDVSLGLKAGSRHVPEQRFVLCFTSKGDLLSQWRGYASPPFGYSLEFPFTAIAQMAEDAGGTLQPCRYSRSDQEKLVVEAVGRAIDRFESQPSVFPGMVDLVRTALLRELDEVALLLKDSTFKEEQEWRLILQSKGVIKFRASRRGVVPYMEVPLPIQQRRDGLEVSLLSRVILGPGARLQDAEVAEALLRERGLRDAQVVVSNSPFDY